MLRRIMHSRSVFDSKKWVEERQEMEKRIKVGGCPARGAPPVIDTSMSVAVALLQEMSEFDETGKAKGFVAGTGQDMALSMGAASRCKLNGCVDCDTPVTVLTLPTRSLFAQLY